jgi:hypothetical protein
LMSSKVPRACKHQMFRPSKRAIEIQFSNNIPCPERIKAGFFYTFTSTIQFILLKASCQHK